MGVVVVDEGPGVGDVRRCQHLEALRAQALGDQGEGERVVVGDDDA